MSDNLLVLFQHSNWAELHVRSPDMEMYITKESAGSNPIRWVDELPESQPEARPVASEPVQAMHLGSFVPRVVEGESLGEGEELGWLEVLQERHPYCLR